jgi:ABC-type nitrate/sulfonate/bicarbonate transport system substrate-binding protein
MAEADSKSSVPTRKLGLALGGIAALALLVAAFLHLGPQTETALPLRLAAYEGDVGALEWIAFDKGFFGKAGLKVEIKGYATGKETVDALQAGQADVATAAELVVATRSFSEPNLRILADICRYWNKGMVARRDAGIATAADLKGKKIGVTTQSSAEHNLMVFLALHGLTVDDVQSVNLLPKQIVEQIGAGGIDAAITWEPHVSTIAKKLGDNGVMLMDRGTEAHLLILTSQEHLPAQSEAIKRLLKALLMAEDWVRANPKEAKAYIAGRFKLDMAYIEMLWPRMQLTVSLPQEILEAMDSEARWFAKKNNKDSTPNYAHTIRTPELAAIKPSAVTVFTQ